jgi:hypothetical protein
MNTKNPIQTIPGKFQGEPMSTEYFWDVSLNGNAEIETFEDGSTLYAVEITDGERQMFGFKGDDEMYVMEETEQGFVRHEVMTKSRWAKMQEIA